LERRSNYIEDPKIANENQIERYFNERSKQSKGSEKCSKYQEGTPQGTCTNRISISI
jgi:hypothetical protein